MANCEEKHTFHVKFIDLLLLHCLLCKISKNKGKILLFVKNYILYVNVDHELRYFPGNRHKYIHDRYIDYY